MQLNTYPKLYSSWLYLRAMKNENEERLYPLVANWLKNSHHCFLTRTNTGLKYSRIDVVGIKDVGGNLSGEIETFSVEVKNGREPFATASGQASGYRVYANRVYLADLRENGFIDEEIAIASHLGIGLIQIEGKKCKEILTSPYYKPLTDLHLRLLEKLSYGHCRFCGCVVEIGSEKNSFSNLSRENMKKAMKDEKGLIFWNHDVGIRKNRYKSNLSDKNITYERRFICHECVWYLSSWMKEISSIMALEDQDRKK
jgi:hypothetical protein